MSRCRCVRTPRASACECVIECELATAKCRCTQGVLEENADYKNGAFVGRAAGEKESRAVHPTDRLKFRATRFPTALTIHVTYSVQCVLLICVGCRAQHIAQPRQSLGFVVLMILQRSRVPMT